MSEKPSLDQPILGEAPSANAWELLKHNSGRHLLDMACVVHVIEVSEGRYRPTRRQMFMTGMSWSAAIRAQDSARYTTRRLYHLNGQVVDAFKRPVHASALVAGQSYTLEAYKPFQPGVA